MKANPKTHPVTVELLLRINRAVAQILEAEIPKPVPAALRRG